MRDRSVVLVMVGIVEILVGGVLLLLVPLSILGGSLQQASGMNPTPIDVRSVLVSVGFDLALAAFFVATGVGTIRRRRWARTLMHSVAGLWLIVGVAAFALWIALSPSLDALIASGQDDSLPAGAMNVVKLLLSLVFLVVYVALPAALFLILRSPSIRATFERHDPTIPWTDRVSARVLGMILTLVYLGATGLMLVPFGGVPFFGILLGRGLSAAVWVLVAVACGVLARGFYRGDARALWWTIALTVLGTASAVWTFLRVNLDELWSDFGLRGEQLDLLRGSWLLSRTGLIWMALLSGASVAGYAIYIRRDLTRSFPIDSAIRSEHDPGHE